MQPAGLYNHQMGYQSPYVGYPQPLICHPNPPLAADNNMTALIAALSTTAITMSLQATQAMSETQRGRKPYRPHKKNQDVRELVIDYNHGQKRPQKSNHENGTASRIAHKQTNTIWEDHRSTQEGTQTPEKERHPDARQLSNVHAEKPNPVQHMNTAPANRKPNNREPAHNTSADQSISACDAVNVTPTGSSKEQGPFLGKGPQPQPPLQ
jgi:hypothetical protein